MVSLRNVGAARRGFPVERVDKTIHRSCDIEIEESKPECGTNPWRDVLQSQPVPERYPIFQIQSKHIHLA